MTRRLRIIKGAGLLTLTEIVSRFFPLIIIRQTKEALGLEAFGEMAVLLASIDILIQLIGPGYGTFAALSIAKNPSDRLHVSRVASLTVCIRAIHAFVILLLLIPLASRLSGQSTAIVFGLTALSFATVFDFDFLHSSLQKMSSYSMVVLASKITGFVLIITSVTDPADKFLYCALVLGTNSAISLGTFFYHKQHVSWQRPTKASLYKFAKDSLPFNLGLITAGLVDRLDLVMVKKFFTAADAGAYAIPLKLTQSITPLLLSVARVFFSEMLAADVDPRLITKIVRTEVLLTLGVLMPICAASYWTGPYVLNAIFAIDAPSYGMLLALLALSSSASCLIHIFGYQLLWRYQRGHLVIKTMAFVLLSSIILGGLGGARLGLGVLGIPLGIIVAKLVACAIFVKASASLIDVLPSKELGVILGSSAIMAAVISQIQDPLVAIVGGLATYLFLQAAYFVWTKDHPLKR
jgi:O-antigen/teichoic acid export membrane protein